MKADIEVLTQDPANFIQNIKKRTAKSEYKKVTTKIFKKVESLEEEK